jgi:hypothetical protein
MSEDSRRKPSPHHKHFKREEVSPSKTQQQMPSYVPKIQIKLQASCAALPKFKIPAQRQLSQHYQNVIMSS